MPSSKTDHDQPDGAVPARAPEAFSLRAAGPLRGDVSAPGDKSISHRALILGAMADGETTVTGLLEGDDVLRTAAAMRALGAHIERDGRGAGAVWRIAGAHAPVPGKPGALEKPLYFGNAGTGARLVMGAAAGRGIAASFDGDQSLRARPMDRIADPLALMGVQCRPLGEPDEKGGPLRLPCTVEPPEKLKAIDYTLPKPSAQIKSAILLAALGAEGETVIREPEPCRDHSERMLAAFGAKLSITTERSGRVIRLAGPQRVTACNTAVPGDPSSAAFPIAAALIVEGSDIVVRDVLVNPLRAGFYETLVEMGADISFENRREVSGEPIADIRARYSPRLKGVAAPASRSASMIDEYPILAIVAAFADGDTYMPGVQELRVKESDRIASVEAGLKANGVGVESGGDWMRVMGRGRTVAGGGRVSTHHDHRIAMSFLVMGLATQKPAAIDDAAMIATSFPTFFDLMAQLGAAGR
ncbi:MAG: 3-phosphoshikimate 1-carboxyvinyltransferase [Pseudomonadota bacterium]